jgi:hypothetical protein
LGNCPAISPLRIKNLLNVNPMYFVHTQ